MHSEDNRLHGEHYFTAPTIAPSGDPLCEEGDGWGVHANMGQRQWP
jgi:hypothetical protein